MTEPDQPFWAPKLFARQWEIFNFASGILLADGTRWAGKTVAILHRIVRHLWEVPNGRFAIFAKSVKLAKDGGSWQLLLEYVLPQWIEANILGESGLPLELLTRNAEGEPDAKVDANTRTAYFEMRNTYGQSSQCMLFSINNENEIEEKVKNKSFSGMYFIELTNWTERRLLPITLASLRMPGLSHLEEKHTLWIGDTNPDPVLGRESPWYKIFYVERNKPPLDDEEGRKLASYYKRMSVITMHWRDNPTFGQFQEENLLGSCYGDKALREAYYDGTWGDGGAKLEKHLAGFFIKSKHVIGGHEDEGDQIDVSAATTELICGWDMGGINHAWSMWEKIPLAWPLSRWNLLDELLSINEEIMLEDFTAKVLEKMREIEQTAGRKFVFKHWSDEDAVKTWRPNTGSFDYQTVYAASAGEITLQGVAKPPHSRQARVRLFKVMFKSNRMHVSSRCVHSIATFENLRKTKTEYLAGDDKWIHTFSADSYPVFAESQEELSQENFIPTATQHEPSESAIISV